jgi:hypothetical protein
MEQAFDPFGGSGAGMGAGVGGQVGDMFDDALPVKPMAKGGTMTPNKIYKFGEEGVELGVPTGDGNMHVIPHGATKKLLPMLENVTPRARGGMMEMRTPQATFAGGETPYGPVYGQRQT